MTHKSLYIVVALALAFTGLARTGPLVHAQPPRALLVIVSGATGVTDISAATLRRIFAGSAAEYRSGKRYLPLNHPLGTAQRTLFDQTVMGLAPDEVGRYWVDQKIRGAAQPPRTLPSAELAVRVVASFPGAITYTEPGLVGPGLTVLTIDGKGPKDPGYPFAR